MKDPEQSWSERRHYIREDINPDDTRPGEMFAYVVILVVAVVCGVGLYFSA